MKIAVTGASGFLGRNLTALLENNGHQVTKIYGRNSVDGGKKLDLLDFKSVEDFVSKTEIDCLVHAAACCNVNDVNKDPDYAKRVNVDATINLAALCSAKKVYFLFISTNYVFDGKSPPFNPDSPTAPVNDYGQQKVAAETALLKHNQTAVLRIPLQYGNHHHLKPSSRAILEAVLSARNELVKLDNDQVRTPTYVMNTASVIEQLCVKKWTGKFNYCDGLQVTRYQFAKMVAKALNFQSAFDNLRADTIPPSVKRPKNCFMVDPRLDSIKPTVNAEAHIKESWSGLIESFNT